MGKKKGWKEPNLTKLHRGKSPTNEPSVAEMEAQFRGKGKVKLKI